MQITRFLVDKTAEAALPTGLNQLLIRAGYVQHLSILPSEYYPERIDFYSVALFYGVMQFRLNFSCIVGNSMNNPPTPRAETKIGYAVFL